MGEETHFASTVSNLNHKLRSYHGHKPIDYFEDIYIIYACAPYNLNCVGMP
jgi:hypothetical protein